MFGKNFLAIKAGIVSLALAASGGAFAAEGKESTQRFRVTVKNVTAGNGLSPFLAVILEHNQALFSIGAPASAGISQVAETGNTATLEAELAERAGVVTTAHAPGAPIPPGQTRSVEIEVSTRALHAGATLNIVAMIGKSNDSFVSASGFVLGAPGWRSVTIRASNFDAGSEENTGNVGDFGAGGHPVEGAEGRVSYDRGLNPRGDAPEVIGWGPVAALVTIERL